MKPSKPPKLCSPKLASPDLEYESSRPLRLCQSPQVESKQLAETSKVIEFNLDDTQMQNLKEVD